MDRSVELRGAGRLPEGRRPAPRPVEGDAVPLALPLREAAGLVKPGGFA